MTLRFLFMDESYGAYFLDEGEKTLRLSGAPYAISRPVKVEYGQQLKILRADSGRKNASKSPILNLRAPMSGVSALVVVKPSGPNSSNYQATFLENSTSVREPQTVQLYNLGVTDTAVLIGENLEQIAPGKSTLVQLNPDSRNRVVAKIGEKTVEGWRLIYDGVIALRPGQAMTAVIVYSPTGMRHTYTDQEIMEFGEPKPGHFWLTFVEDASRS
ncbi:hypothetical protein [Cerasicoccus frondis]|uniref:hypothetical protein n=1 Tax=Cerasicoccus frondis TaxID=490090 RepID=UPI002852C24F|nr:hypothetical protein [Cerasicoccus frondis]